MQVCAFYKRSRHPPGDGNAEACDPPGVHVAAHTVTTPVAVILPITPATKKVTYQPEVRVRVR